MARFILFLYSSVLFLNQSVFSQTQLQLKDLYVTSISIPHSTNSPLHLIDGDYETHWTSMKGAGPDEGIMLYFNEPAEIGYLRLAQSQTEPFAQLTGITYYVNGSNPRTAFIKNDPLVEVNTSDVRSLYIKFSNFPDLVTEYVEYIAVRSFGDQYTGVSEIELYDFDREQYKILSPNIVRAQVTASSTLNPKLSYGVQNMFDGKKEFGWVEGVDGNGINETISILMDEPKEVTGIKISNGYQRSTKHYTSNARVRSLKVNDENGSIQNVSIADEMGEQTVLFDTPLEGKNITFLITGSYPGAAYKDLVISQLKLIGRDGEILIDPEMVEPIKKELLSKVSGTILEDIVDKRIYNAVEEMEGYQRSIILRSDYTFVAYSSEWAEDDNTNEVIAEGNWQIKELEGEKARIRVFGKLTKVSTIIDYYKGNSESSFQKIFQDHLNIDQNSISGEKYLNDFKLFPNG